MCHSIYIQKTPFMTILYLFSVAGILGNRWKIMANARCKIDMQLKQIEWAWLSRVVVARNIRTFYDRYIVLARHPIHHLMQCRDEIWSRYPTGVGLCIFAWPFRHLFAYRTQRRNNQQQWMLLQLVGEHKLLKYIPFLHCFMDLCMRVGMN